MEKTAPKPTWKDTFNATTAPLTLFDAARVAHKAGYSYVCWNGSVYEILKRGDDRLDAKFECREADLDNPASPTGALLSQTAQIILEYLPPHLASNCLARLHASFPQDPEEIRTHLNKVHQELEEEIRVAARGFSR